MRLRRCPVALILAAGKLAKRQHLLRPGIALDCDRRLVEAGRSGRRKAEALTACRVDDLQLAGPEFAPDEDRLGRVMMAAPMFVPMVMIVVMGMRVRMAVVSSRLVRMGMRMIVIMPTRLVRVEMVMVVLVRMRVGVIVLVIAMILVPVAVIAVLMIAMTMVAVLVVSMALLLRGRHAGGSVSLGHLNGSAIGPSAHDGVSERRQVPHEFPL
jgi:hypothetical protein